MREFHAIMLGPDGQVLDFAVHAPSMGSAVVKFEKTAFERQARILSVGDVDACNENLQAFFQKAG